MLKEIFIENYKSLKKTKVEFKDGLNIIIGKNGSGKSNLLEFIKSIISISPFISDLNNVNRFPAHNFSYKFAYTNDSILTDLILSVTSQNTISMSGINIITNVLVEKSDVNKLHPINKTYSFSTEQINNNTINRSELLKEIQQIKSLQSELFTFGIPYNLLWLDRPSKIHVGTSYIKIDGVKFENSLYLSADGETDNFNFTFFLLHKYKTSIFSAQKDSEINKITTKEILFDSFRDFIETENIAESLKLYTPIEEIRISANVNIYNIDDKILVDNLTLEFKIDDAWVPWSYLSDGMKRIFYLVAGICSTNNSLILIEEPELGIHPHQLYKLMQFIKEQSEHKQIIISTHSPLVLDCLEADELDRIIIAKSENGSSQFRHLTVEQKEKAKVYMHEEMDLSFYWLHSDLETA